MNEKRGAQGRRDLTVCSKWLLRSMLCRLLTLSGNWWRFWSSVVFFLLYEGGSAGERVTLSFNQRGRVRTSHRDVVVCPRSRSPQSTSRELVTPIDGAKVYFSILGS